MLYRYRTGAIAATWSTQIVMPGLVPGMTAFKTALRKKTWMAGIG
jgi:hypothetical protein